MSDESHLVKEAAAVGFRLVLAVTGGNFDTVIIQGPTGATVSIDWGNGTSSTATCTGNNLVNVYVNNGNSHPCGSTVTITGPNSITYLNLFVSGSNSITDITGIYPTSLETVIYTLNYAIPSFTPANCSEVWFKGSVGPLSITYGSNLVYFYCETTNTKSVDFSACTKLTMLPTSRSPITTIKPPAYLTSLDISGNTKLTSIIFTSQSKLVSLNVRGCSALTSLSKLPTSLTTLHVENSGLTTLDLTGTSVTAINIPRSMYPQLQYLKLTGSKMKFSGLYNFPKPPDGAQWILY